MSILHTVFETDNENSNFESLESDCYYDDVTESDFYELFGDSESESEFGVSECLFFICMILFY